MKITKGTVARTIILALALLNQVMVCLGHAVIDIDNETVTQLVNATFTVVASILAWWKNNSFTENALYADSYKNMLDIADKSTTDGFNRENEVNE